MGHELREQPAPLVNHQLYLEATMNETTRAPDGAQRMGKSQADRVRDYARHTTGSEAFHRHWTGKLVYTDGVRFMAEECGAWWLVDLIASWQIKARVRAEPFQLWLLSAPASESGPWVASCWTDTPGEGRRVARQTMEYSDFPEELAPFRLYAEQSGAGLVLMLPEER